MLWIPAWHTLPASFAGGRQLRQFVGAGPQDLEQSDELVQHWRHPRRAVRPGPATSTIAIYGCRGLVVIALAASLALIGIEWIEPSFQIADRVSGLLRQIDFNRTLMHGMLSFLLFAGALHADFSAFKDLGLIIGMMAVPGTLISTFVVGGAMWLVLGFFGLEVPFAWALVLAH